MKKQFLWLLICSMAGHGVFAGETPEWLNGWSFGGDFRLRYEGTDFENDAVKDRNRGRYRLRLAAKKKLTDSLNFELRLASGTGEATSTNQTFDESFSGKDLVIDRAYLTYDINEWVLGGGKVKNPFHTTNVVWDSDVNQEGLFQKYDNKTFYAVFGEMLVEEESSKEDTNLIAGQLGTKKKGVYNASLAFYSYQNLTMGAGKLDYEFLELVGQIHLGQGNLQLTYVNNFSSEIDDEETAYAVFYNFEKGKYSFEAKYAHIEANSVYGRFADSDFGFADKEGFTASVDYQLSKYVSCGVTLFSVDSILAEDDGFNRVFLDMNLKL